jgi:hypothetical protein
MLENPKDSAAESWQHLEQARRLKVDPPIFFISTPYPRTELREELMKLGLSRTQRIIQDTVAF